MRRLHRPAKAPSRQRRRGLLVLLLPFVLGACDDGAPPSVAEVRPVRVVTVAPRSGGDSVSLTGTVAAETEVNLAFRIDGRMVERLVNVGDRVKAGQVVARLDRTNEENGLRAARADLAAARARLTEARNNYQRQRELLQTGFTTRVRYDEATRTLRSARIRARRRAGPGEHRREPARLYRAACRCRRRRHRPRRRARRGGAGRPHDRPARPRGRPRRGLRRAGRRLKDRRRPSR